MNRKSIAFVVGLIATVLSTFIINNVVVRGATLGGEGISKESIFNARLNPESYYWEAFPYSLMAGIVVGVVAFAITYFLIPKKSQK